MPAAPVPTPVAADSTGLDQASWIADVRDALEDFPHWVLYTWQADGVGGISAAGSAPVSIQQPKINGSSAASDNTPIMYRRRQH